MIEYHPIRKTAYMMWKKCQKQFEYFYNSDEYWGYQGKSANETTSQAKGNLFHKAAEDFFNNLNVEVAYQLANDKIPIYFSSLFPEGSQLQDWFDYFVKIESMRFIYGRDTMKEEIIKSFKPLAMEMKLSMKDEIDRTGHVDRLDYFVKDKALCVVEYKTGMYYNLEKSRVMTSLRAECGWYATMINNNKLYEFPVRYIAIINPTRKQMVVERISPLTLRALDVSYKKLVTAIKQGGPFPPNYTPLCLNCRYVTDCLYNNPNANFTLGVREEQTIGEQQDDMQS